MILIKINQDESVVYPYSIKKLKEDNPNTSFPENFNDQILKEFNVYKVNIVIHDNDYTKNYTEGIPTLVNEEYYQNWIITDATQEEIDNRINNQWEIIKLERNRYLQESDWTQLSDSPLNSEKKQEWILYRQELRNITLQENPFNIIWPVKPF